MMKALAGLVIAFVLAIVGAHVAYTKTSPDKDRYDHGPWSQDRMDFVAWNGDRWTAWIHDGEFVHVPQDAPGRSRHIKRSIAYLDWNGEPWQAKIDDDGFLLAHRGDWQGQVERAEAIRFRDWAGNRQLRTAAQLR